MSRGGNIFRIIFNAAVFILLEAAALVMLKHDGPMQDIWLSKGIHAFQGAVWGGTESIRDYFSLRKQNAALAEENYRLRNVIREYRAFTGKEIAEDSARNVIGGFRYLHAEAVKVSNNKQHNYLILDKGSEDGIEKLSGVITENGVAGIIDAVGKHYSYARSFKNTGMTVSARIGKEGPAGELIWNGVTSNGAILREIPQHIHITEGDTVYTSGFSSIFPADIPLGITGEASVVNGSTYDVKVTLFSDFSAIRYVTVVNNTDDTEIEELEVEDED